MILPSPLMRKLSARFALSYLEIAMIERLEKNHRTFAPGQQLIHEGQGHLSAFILRKGWAFSSKILPNGSRQIIEIQIPGDFLGLRSVLFNASDHNIEALTQIQASEVLLSDVSEALSQYPLFAAAILWAAARDEAMVVEHVVDLGRRSAEERIVHFVLELAARLRLVGIGDDTGFDCPLTQQLLADVMGLSSIHVNRILRSLREEGLLTFQKGRVSLDDSDRLKCLASFDPAYLDQGKISSR